MVTRTAGTLVIRVKFLIIIAWTLLENGTVAVIISISWEWRERRGRIAIPNAIPSSAPSKVQQARERSLGVHGARIFNLLPSNLKNENSGDFALFKNH